ncbi:ribonuclease T2 [Microvirga flavescens]|uniref:ribonuclease T2 n=1 Tax=Microvirga flavescens TaxID=2249811 RepID=UPI001FE07D62|nr:ribonuclease T2 [Microvirga flavescens]
MDRARRALFGALLALASPAFAQDLEQRGAPAGQFDFYVLALSWSPGFCELSGGAKKRDQCNSGRGLSFVVHGLWPQNEQDYPVFCEPSGRFVPRMALEEAQGVFPEEGLARYEWRKHGTCSGVSPSEYFRLVRQARDRVRIPESFTKVTSDVKTMPMEIERVFMEANPGLRQDMMAVSCKRRVLEEVRICLDRDLRQFRQCPGVDRAGCRYGDVVIPALR